MTFSQYIKRACLLGLIFVAAVTVQAASITQLTSAGQIKGSDYDFISSAPVGAVFVGPAVAFDVPFGAIGFSRGSGDYEVDQVGTNYSGSAFGTGTIILAAGGFQGSGDGGPVTLQFANPVSEFGLNIEDFDTGAYTVKFTAFDSGGGNLGTFSASGNDPASLSFEGLRATSPNIAKVVFDDSAAGGSNDLLFGNITFDLPLLGSGGPSPAPEPSTVALFGFGLFGIGALRRWLSRN